MALEVAIIGGGIAGLAAAIGASRAGHKVHLLEQADAIRPLGACLSIWPNAMQCLREWGLDADLISRSAPLDAVALRRVDGRAYVSFDLSELHQKFGAQSVCARRSVLQDVLLSALDPSCVHLGFRVTGFEQAADGSVMVAGQDRASIRADLVIGADGIWSNVRTKIIGDGPPIYAGYGAWLGIAPKSEMSGEGTEIAEYIGTNGRFGLAPADDSSVYWFFVENAKKPRQKAGPADAAPLLNALRAWPQRFEDIVTSATATDIVYAPFFERPVHRIWGAGSVVLAGDAMHPFTPNLGQGACQAIEDAFVLQELLTGATDVDGLVAAYQKRRKRRVTMFAKEARKIGQLAQMDRAPKRWIRDAIYGLMRPRTFEKNLTKQFDRASHAPNL